MIYYGDEIGMPGAGDPDNRRFMQWERLHANQTWLRDRHRRAREDARRAPGDAPRHAHDARRRRPTSFVYKMTTAGDTVFVALNRGDAAAAAPNLPAGNYIDLISGATVSAPLSCRRAAPSCSRRSRRTACANCRRGYRLRGLTLAQRLLT